MGVGAAQASRAQQQHASYSEECAAGISTAGSVCWSPAQPTDFIRSREFVEEEIGEREKSERVYALVGRRDELGVKCSKLSFWLPANKE